ncbi:hypothetical protein [Brevundimonas sp. SORGH_AS_0993]|uniref:hypothetical protein n=1 Tax=Brevundimonas sp. SORGH_AS_0993 TaxID=3041794 RepID=UPI002786EE1D|nr:hypothetical protein [Brevundimonas sp. SORGH_AS_0993]MDQ1153194.1 hypothetical protein [Brevundimonas sp. SORGH_AS_0993]
MSADEFDPMIERMFARTPPLADQALFLAVFQARLEKRSRWRSLILTAAGVIGGGLALREGVHVNFSDEGGAPVVRGVTSAASAAQDVVQTGLDGVGLGSLDLMSGSGMVMFWAVAGALVALLAAGAVKLSQDI